MGIFIEIFQIFLVRIPVEPADSAGILQEFFEEIPVEKTDGFS